MSVKFEKDIVDGLSKRFENAEFVIQDVNKNNGTVRRSLLMREPGKNCSPCVYLDNYEEAVEDGKMTLDSALERIADVFDSAEADRFSPVANDIDKKKILDMVQYSLVNRNANSNLISDAPYVSLEDLAGMYRCVVDDSDSYFSFVITNSIMRRFDIKFEELNEAAKKNTKEKSGFRIRTMASVMAELTGQPEAVFESSVMELYVLTNKTCVYGATILLYEEYLDELARNVKDDLFLLPSSIHEVLAVPANGMSVKELRGIVGQINDSDAVGSEEVLSGNVYRYSKETGKLRIA